MPGQQSRENGRKGGRPKGFKTQETLSKEAARDFLRQQVIASLRPMIEAQIANATGIKYLVTRAKKTGKFIRVGPAMAERVDEETIEVWEKDPATPAFTDLLNRALDKPAEHVQMTVTKVQESTDDELKARMAALLEKL